MTKKTKNRLLFAAQDPGGFNALAPVIKDWSAKTTVRTLLASSAAAMARQQKMAFSDASAFTAKDINRLLYSFRPQVIVTATSDGWSLEKKLITAAKQQAIPVVTIIDFWTNYKKRFSHPGETDLAFLPQAICVIDQIMRQDLLKQGFAPALLHLTGNPYFSTFKKQRPVKGNYFLFADQPFSELYSRKTAGQDFWFNEVEVLSDLVKALAALKISQPLVIGLHPRSKKINKYQVVISRAKQKISLASKPGSSLIKRAAAVIGINTAVLWQAALLGKKVVSYQPGLSLKQDPLISNRLGLSWPAYNYRQLVNCLRRALMATSDHKKLVDVRNRYMNNQAVAKVSRVIKKFL